MTQWGRAERVRVARATAAAFLDGDWEPAGMVARAATAFGRRPRWLTNVAAEAAASYRERPADRPRELTAVIEQALHRLDDRDLLPRPLRMSRLTPSWLSAHAQAQCPQRTHFSC